MEKEIEKVYQYKDRNENLLYEVVRFKPKSFAIRRPDGNGGWIWNLKGVKTVIYNLPEIIKEENKLVVIVEGEKDVEALKKNGFTATCNPMGAGKWKEEYSQQIKGRNIVVIPDADKAGLKHAEQVCKSLLKFNCSVKLLSGLPAKDVSEYLEKYSPEGLQAVINNANHYDKNLLALEKLNLSNINPYLRPALDFHNEFFLCYPIDDKDALWVTSNRQLLGIDEMKDQFVIKTIPEITNGISKETIEAFISKKEEIDLLSLYQSIYDLLNNHIHFSYKWQSVLLTLWIIGTYLHPIFNYYGYIWVNSPTKRCGKTLLLEILSYLCFNATSVLIEPSEAYLYRSVDQNSNTLIIDEVEKATNKDKELRQGLFAILNAGFKKNSKVPRVNKNSHSIEHFDCYSPKVFAGINNIGDTLKDRSFRIELFRKKRIEKLQRFDPRKLNSEIEGIRNGLYIFALKYAKEVCDLYNSDRLSIPDELDDRAKDILEPLFAIAGIIDVTTYETTREIIVTPQLKEAALEINNIRVDDESIQETFAVAVNSLYEYLEDNKKIVDVIKTKEAVEIFQKGGLEWLTEDKYAQSLLRKMGFRSNSHWIGDNKIIRGYKIDLSILKDLMERYPVLSLQDSDMLKKKRYEALGCRNDKGLQAKDDALGKVNITGGEIVVNTDGSNNLTLPNGFKSEV